MPVFTVELTSGETYQPLQVTTEAQSPGEAIIQALRESYGTDLGRALSQMLNPYDSENDHSGAYEGWSRLVISVDGQSQEGRWVRECEDTDGGE